MKRSFFILTLCLLFYFTGTQAQLPPLQAKAIILKRMVELNHFLPRPVDDSFSVALFNSLLEIADRRNLLFTDAEYKTLLTYSAHLDDELNRKSWKFLDVFESLYKRALTRADSIINKLLQKPFDFSANEFITTSEEHTFNFAKDLTALSLRWSRHLKYMALDQLVDMAATDDSAGKTTLKTVIAQSEAKVREHIRMSESKTLKKILNHPDGFSEYIAQLYLNAIASGFDPHTNYFSAEGKEEFRSALSAESLSFGLWLDENEKGQIIIDQLTPGGPAWKSGELNEGDELLSLQWEGKQAVEMTGLTLEDAYEIFGQSINDRLVVQSLKPDGTIKTVFLRKEKIENTENIVKGFVLKGEKKIGYILLPSFYTQWENETGSSCANDVAKEIVKLKKENMDALILDIRYNGGGSVGEAVEMAGIFIDEGPLMGQKQKAGKVVYLKDPNRGTIYNGPMTLMVNGQTASASEILAAALQDYNRALIIGSNTFGKATMQQMMALDTITNKPTMINNAKDILKITTGKLYRLNGETVQLHGISPDIVLPDAFDGLNYQEKFLPFALEPDRVAKNVYYQPLPVLPVPELVKRSEQRVKATREFQEIKTMTATWKARRAKTETIPLNADSFVQWARQYRPGPPDSVENNTVPGSKPFTVDNHGPDKVLLANDHYAKELNNEWLLAIADDIYIQEVFLVLCDLINLQKP